MISKDLFHLLPLIAMVVAVALMFTGCKTQVDPITVPTPKTITQLISSNDRLTLFTAALNRSGLSATLSGAGPFTVFAPSDDAFQAAGFANVTAINAAPDTTLRQLLQYHVLYGSVLASAFPSGQTGRPTSLSTNGTVYISKARSVSGTTGTGLSVNEGRVLQSDVLASNGVIHVIDKVLMPSKGTILAIVRADTSLSLLAALAERAGANIITSLSAPSPLTIFAPTNAVFRAAGISDTTAIREAPVDVVTRILTNHFVPNVRAYTPTLSSGVITTTAGGSLTVTAGTGSNLSITSPGSGTSVARLTVANINATNGVIHKIDQVLLP